MRKRIKIKRNEDAKDSRKHILCQLWYFLYDKRMESVMNSLTILCHFTLTDTLGASSQGNY